jgi:hypothetical protein
MRAVRFEFNRQLGKIGKPLDRTESDKDKNQLFDVLQNVRIS